MTRSSKEQLRGSGAKRGSKLSRDGELAGGQGTEVAKSNKAKSLVEFFRESPLVGVELDLERDRDDVERSPKQ